MKKKAHVLVLTSFMPNPREQAKHDRDVKVWLGNGDHLSTVFDWFRNEHKTTFQNAEERVAWLLDKIRERKPDIVDCSMDHFWRDVIESGTGLSVKHHPYLQSQSSDSI